MPLSLGKLWKHAVPSLPSPHQALLAHTDTVWKGCTYFSSSPFGCASTPGHTAWKWSLLFWFALFSLLQTRLLPLKAYIKQLRESHLWRTEVGGAYICVYREIIYACMYVCLCTHAYAYRHTRILILFAMVKGENKRYTYLRILVYNKSSHIHIKQKLKHRNIL